MTNPLGSLLDNSLLGRALDHLPNLFGGQGAGQTGLSGAPGLSGDGLPPEQLPLPGQQSGAEPGKGGAMPPQGLPGPPSGGPPLPQGIPNPGPGGPTLPQGPSAPGTGGPLLPQAVGNATFGNPVFGGPAPQGMQNVFPNIVQQLGNPLAQSLPAAGLPAGARALPVPAAPTQTALPTAVNNAAPGLPAGTTATTSAVTTALPAATPSPVAANAQVAAPATSTPVTPARTNTESQPLPASRPGDAAMPPRTESIPLLNRLAAALQLGALAPSTAPAATLPPGTTQATVNVAGSTVAPLTMPLTDARGAVLPANDNAAMRRDLGPAVIAGHTLEGTQRQLARQRAYLLPQGLNRWLAALGGIGAQTDDPEEIARAVERVFQWLFWVLAIVAYGCLAATILALIGGQNGWFAPLDSGQASVRSYVVGFAAFGLLSGGAAWWLARRAPQR